MIHNCIYCEMSWLETVHCVRHSELLALFKICLNCTFVKRLNVSFKREFEIN